MTSLYTTTYGDPALPSVALVHGMMSSSRQWQPNIEALAQRFRLVSIDLWGHGGSSGPAGADAYTAAGLVAAVDEVRRRLGIDRWALVGHSFGAAVCLRYALDRPEVTRAVLFTNSRAAFSPATAETAAEAADNIRDDQDPRSLPQHPIHARHIPAPLHAQLVRDADRTDLGALRSLLRWHWQLSVRAVFERLAVPLTMINGRFERRYQPTVERLRSSPANLAIVDVDAGHSPNVEVAEEFNRLAAEALTP